jgi:septal ring factor EnvC (AmiA/AmiB activator)
VRGAPSSFGGWTDKFISATTMNFSTRFLLFVAATLAITACDSPRAQANVAQALNDAATEISGLRNDLAMLQTQLDSLRDMVAKQDTNIARIAAVNNIPISK